MIGISTKSTVREFVKATADREGGECGRVARACDFVRLAEEAGVKREERTIDGKETGHKGKAFAFPYTFKGKPATAFQFKVVPMSLRFY